MERFPDFIFGGTPSLHFILDQHPEIGLPEDVIYYFDTNDPIARPDFFFQRNG